MTDKAEKLYQIASIDSTIAIPHVVGLHNEHDRNKVRILMTGGSVVEIPYHVENHEIRRIEDEVMKAVPAAAEQTSESGIIARVEVGKKIDALYHERKAKVLKERDEILRLFEQYWEGNQLTIGGAHDS